MMWTRRTIATWVLLMLAILDLDTNWLPQAGLRAEPPRPMPPPGGEAPVTRERLTRAYLDAIRDSHHWVFKGNKFILVGDDRPIPPALQKALLGTEGKTTHIRGGWTLDTKKGMIVLTSITADGKPGRKEVSLGIGPAGLMRVNIEHGGQYNVYSFDARLPTPKGVTFPIYEFATRIDQEFLQGTWQVQLREIDGKKVPAENVKGDQIEIKGKSFTMTAKGAVSKGTCTIDAVPVPGTLDVTFTEGPQKGNSYLAIYRLDGDSLKLYRAGPGKKRPTSFHETGDNGQVLETLQRKVKE